MATVWECSWDKGGLFPVWLDSERFNEWNQDACCDEEPQERNCDIQHFNLRNAYFYKSLICSADGIKGAK